MVRAMQPDGGMATRKNNTKTRRRSAKTADSGTGKRRSTKTARASTMHGADPARASTGDSAKARKDSRGRKPGTVNRRRPETERAPKNP